MMIMNIFSKFVSDGEQCRGKAEDTDHHLVEISAVNGRFTLDFTQAFSSPVYVNTFLKELDENGITYDLQDVSPLELPNIKLPWSE